MRNRSITAAALSVACASSPVMGQDGALWRDEKGRQMEVGFAGGSAAGPASVQRSTEAMADLFKQVCVATNGEPAAVKAASLALEMVDKSYDLPVGKKQASWPLVIARGDGVVVSQADRFLGNPRPQCNVTFYLLEPLEMANVESALVAAMGRQPDNAADRVKKNGGPNRYFIPRWSVTQAETAAATVSVTPVGSAGRSGYQFSLLANTEAQK